MPSSAKFTKFRWICTMFGLLFSVADVASDLLLCTQYVMAPHYSWFALTLLFILSASVCSQIFSYMWFLEDSGGTTSHPSSPPGEQRTCRHTAKLTAMHLLQMGFYTRYCDLLKQSFNTVWRANEAHVQSPRKLFALATDLSMLRLFETFLESVPQLLLQLYIMLKHQHCSTLQYISMVVSFLNIAWTTVDFWRCFRRCLPGMNNVPGGISTAVYLLYKLLTISARILSLSLLILLDPMSLLALAVVWLVGFVWTHVVKTAFCTSACMEELYRGVIGFILVFTFFNVKGKATKTAMTVYYALSTLQNVFIPLLFYLFKPSVEEMDFFLPMAVVILIANSLGLGLLILYYRFLHPQRNRVADEVDGRADVTESATRMDQFLSI